jgi:hypothetical protein
MRACFVYSSPKPPPAQAAGERSTTPESDSHVCHPLLLPLHSIVSNDSDFFAVVLFNTVRPAQTDTPAPVGQPRH